MVRGSQLLLDALPRSIAGRYAIARVSSRVSYDAPAKVTRLDSVDVALVCIFLVGLYTNHTIMISQKVPLPSAPSGIAGLILLWRWRDLITQRALIGLLVILTLYLVSILLAPNINWLSRRANSLIQLTYSLIIGYALFLTVCQASHRQAGGLFLGFALVILIGCLLESHAGFRPVSDAVRNVLYSKGVYENDLRDLLFYNRVRPKFFASQPSSATSCYTLFTFIWLVTSAWRWKLPLYLVLVGLGLFTMPGPTLLLMLLLPHMLFLDSRRGGRIHAARFLVVAMVATLFALMAMLLATTLFAERLESVTSGNDPSFFYRVQGPTLAGLDIMGRYPATGAGLTGEPFVEREITNLYLRSRFYSAGWNVVSVHRAADQLFLAALDLSRLRRRRRHDSRHFQMAAYPRRPQCRLLLGDVGDTRPGLGRLCRPDLLGGAVSGRRYGHPASACPNPCTPRVAAFPAGAIVAATVMTVS